MYCGQNGVITSFVNGSEKVCVTCEYWTGGRDITYNGTAATSHSSGSAYCIKKGSDTFPNAACTCNGQKYEAWHSLKR